MTSKSEENSSHSRFKQQIKEWLQSKAVGEAFRADIHYPDMRAFNRADLASVSFYRRRLPHWEVEGSTYFVTYRLAGDFSRSLIVPVSSNTSVPASIVEESLIFSHGERFLLNAYVIMPDHVHLLIMPIAGWSLARVLKSLKGFTGREINRMLGRRGSVWQAESFDHLVRNEADWFDKLKYIHNNPAEAGLASSPQDYPYSSLVTLHGAGRVESMPHRLHSEEQNLICGADFPVRQI